MDYTIRSIAVMALAALPLAVAAQSRLTVENHLPFDRKSEIVETPAAPVTEKFGESFIITDSGGNEVEWQVTHDGKLIFPADVRANSTTTYNIIKGVAAKKTPKVYGRQFPERKDDMAWENDRSAYRAYGPALEKSGERAFGYDLWTKCVDTLVLEQRFFDHNHRNLSFHKDHGNGMDVYSVGPTLGGGTAALLNDNGEIVYPYCYRDYEILDNGPLRFTVSLTYNPVTVNADTAVVEKRLISLDRGSWLNKTVVSYDGLTTKRTVAPGIVVHRQNPAAYIFSEDGKAMSYADLTDNSDCGNGVMFVGVVVPQGSAMSYQPLAERAGDAVGHILAKASIAPGEDFLYYWGSGWSKGGMPDQLEWQATLERFRDTAASPLSVILE